MEKEVRMGKRKLWLVEKSSSIDSDVKTLQLKEEKDKNFLGIITFSDGEEIRLHYILVESPYKNRGYGRFLISILQERKKKITAYTHFGALGFFLKMGFKKVENDNHPETLEDIEWIP